MNIERISRWRIAALTSLILAFSGVLQVRAAVTVFQNDLVGFNLAAGYSLNIIDFETLAPGTNIAGRTINGITFISPLGNTLEVDAANSTYTPIGFSPAGDTDNRLFATSGTNVLSPGGTSLVPGPDLRQEDGLQLILAVPATDFGIDVLFQSLDGNSATTYEVRNPAGAVIASGPLNIPALGNGADTNSTVSAGGTFFLGFHSDAGDIARIDIIESDNNGIFPDANIGFDTIRFSPVTSIAYLRTLHDQVDFAPTNTSTLFTARGIVTTRTNLTVAASTEFYMQDSTAGIAVFWAMAPGISNTPPAGALVQVTAPLNHFNGLLELAPIANNSLHTVIILSTNNPLPAALAVPFDPLVQTNPASMEPIEGRYAVASNVFLTFGSSNFIAITEPITNALGQTFDIFVNSHTDIPGKQKPVGPVTVFGVLGQFVTNAPYSSGYQLIPSRYADIIPQPPLPALVISCATNRTIECGSPWNFDPPSAVTTCGNTNVTISVMGTITNLLVGGTFTATRTWKATDACSNSAACSQTITAVDTILPLISCSSNFVLECAGPAGNQVFYTTTASDACDTNIILVCTPPSGSYFTRGTNTVVCAATDHSGNSNICSFTVTVIDTTPPLISCPANMNVAEAPRDSGGATVTFPAPTASDFCDSSLTLTSSPPPGSIFAIGSNTVHWTAIDDAGNSNSCTLIVRVIPYRLAVTNLADSGPGTLRQALLDANDSPDENYVYFALPGTAPYIIHILSALPEITSRAIIDGWSQSDSNSPPVIALDGGTASNAIDGLVIRSGRSAVRGLAFGGFANAIRIEGGGTNTLQGNYIGTDLSGTNASPDSGDGIHINSARNLIGGIASNQGNVISGNGANGITIDTAAGSDNVVQGNLIGLGADAVTTVANGRDGVFLDNQAARNLVGNTSGAGGNTIAHNAVNGIGLSSSAGTGNALIGNGIFANASLGIDLREDGVTVNDADDSDTGPNMLQNFPVLTDAISDAGTTTIYGSLTSTPNTVFRVDFYLNDVADPSTYGEGQRYIGATFVALDDSGTQTFVVPFALSANFTQFVTATATDPASNTSEFSQAVQVRTPPVVDSQPSSTNAPLGSQATFCASASGTPPIFYQWRLNGVNIPGATNSCYTIPAEQLGNGGTYTVIVGNDLGALSTATASLGIPLPNVPGGDNFADRRTIALTKGILGSQNRDATFEPGEPLHAGKRGGKSLWYTWTAPVTGVATFSTPGSGFDTLLAVYSGTAFSNLVAVASDEDRGKFYTSQVRFNSIKGRTYNIAVDGFGGESGDFILSWEEEDTPKLLPAFWTQPLSQTVVPGSTVTFTAVAVRVCDLGKENCVNPDHYPFDELPLLDYQWYTNGVPVPGATSPSLTLSNVQTWAVATYVLRVSTPWQYLDSDDAVLQLNTDGQQVQGTDKFLDSADASNVLDIGSANTGPSFQGNDNGTIGAQDVGSVVRGFTGTQTFSTSGSGTDPTEVICGAIGGASEWITLVAEASGNLFLNTDGSSYDTVMAVFKRNPTNSAALLLLSCDNNSGTNGRTSALSIPVTAGQTNYVDIDGVNGAFGSLQLNYSLVTATVIRNLGLTAQGAQRLQVFGRTNLHFIIQASTNMASWTSLITTSAPTGVFDYVDQDSVRFPRRFYRAVLLP